MKCRKTTKRTETNVQSKFYIPCLKEHEEIKTCSRVWAEKQTPIHNAILPYPASDPFDSNSVPIRKETNSAIREM